MNFSLYIKHGFCWLTHHKINHSRYCYSPIATPVSICKESSKQRQNPSSTRPVIHNGDGFSSTLVEYSHQIGHKIQSNAIVCSSFQQLSSCNNNNNSRRSLSIFSRRYISTSSEEFSSFPLHQSDQLPVHAVRGNELTNCHHKRTFRTWGFPGVLRSYPPIRT